MHRSLTARVAGALAGLSASLVLVGTASAGPERVPTQGSPAVTMPAPAGWAVEREERPGFSELFVRAPDSSVMIQVGVVTTAGPPTPPDQLASIFGRNAHADLVGASMAGSIAGHPGRAYNLHMAAQDNHLARIVRLTLVRLDASHLVLVGIFARETLAPAELRQAATIAGGVRMAP